MTASILQPQKRDLSILSEAAFQIAILTSFFVMIEPAPSDILVAIAVALGLVSGNRSRPGPLFLLCTIYILATVLAGLLSSASAVGSIGTVVIRVYLLGILAGFALCFYHIRAEKLIRISTLFIYGGILASLIVVLAKFRIIPGSEIFFYDDFGLRMQGTFKDPNVMGPYVASALVLQTARVFGKPPTLSHVFTLALMTTAVILSGSRGALLVLGVGGLFLFGCFCSNRSLNARPLLTFTLALGALVLIVWGTFALANIGGEAAQLAQRLDAQAYDADRFAGQRVAFEEGAKRVVGYGPDSASDLEFGGLRQDPHNVYAKLLYEGGWLAVISFILISSVAVLRAFSAFMNNQNSREYRLLAAAVSGLVVAHAINGMFVDTTHWRHLFFLIGIGAVLPSFSATRQPPERSSPISISPFPGKFER